MAAVVAGEAVHQPVLDHPGGAIGALETVAAVAAQGQRGKAAAVEEQQRLLFALEVGLELGDQARCEPAAPRRRILGQVDRAHVGQARSGEALGQSDLAVAADLDHVPAFDCRGRRGQDHRHVLEPGAHHRGVASMILNSVFLLERGLVRFVDDDQPEVRIGQEQSRAGADRDLRLAARDRAPGAPPLRRAQVRMPRDRGAAEARLEALEEWLGERDLGQQDQRLFVLPQALGDRLEIDLGLARAGDSVEQHRIEALADRGGEAGRGFDLIAVELGRGEIRIGPGERPVGVDPDRFERSGVDQPAHDAVADPGVIGKLANRALPAFERGERLFALRRHALWNGSSRAIFDELARPIQRGR